MKKGYLTYMLTDTLPNELPIIYSNRGLYTYLLNKSSEWNEFDFKNKDHVKSNLIITVPNKIKIRKNEYEDRVISLMHPYAQMLVAKFIEVYYGVIIDYFVNNSIFSIRKPIGINNLYNPDEKSRYDKEIENILDSDTCPNEFLGDMYIKTFFCLSKYPKITDFFKSYKIKDLELKYKFMRRLDISACFESIYTHSIDWAYLGDKMIAKDMIRNKDDRFSDLMDRITQRMNHNETNGILIGPEYSRLVAELILTRIDRNIVYVLNNKGIKYKNDYEVIRFVDDFFIFFNNPIHGDEIQKVMASKLDEFKLKINDKKTTNEVRPFLRKYIWVTKIKHSLNVMFKSIDGNKEGLSKYLIDLYNETRLLIMDYDNQKGFIVSYVLSTLENRIDYFIEILNEYDNDLKKTKSYLSLIDVIIYIVNYDISTDNIMKICRIMIKIQSKNNSGTTKLEDMIFKKCFTLLKYNVNQHSELLNLYVLLVNNSNRIPNEFLIDNLSDDYLNICSITYYIINKDKEFYNDSIEKINSIISEVIETMKTRFKITVNKSNKESFDRIDEAVCSENFLLIHDMRSTGILNSKNEKDIDKFKNNIVKKTSDKFKLYNLFLEYIQPFDKPFINWNITYEDSVKEMYIKKFAKFNSYPSF